MAKAKHLHGKLLIAAPVMERFRWEIRFLNLGSRLYTPVEGPEIKSAAGLIRWAVQLFVDYCDTAEVPWDPIASEETKPFGFYLSQMGLWDYAIKCHYASTYSDLATQALFWYFVRLDANAEKDLEVYNRLMSMVPEDLMRLFRAGGLDVFQAARKDVHMDLERKISGDRTAE